ncbi:MAG: energy-coupling factor transporter transmembrane component T [Candidatus Bathyarchaeia archaeon]
MSLSFLEGLKFARMDTPLHRADPRAKFLMALSIFASSLAFTNPLALLALLALQIPLILIGRITRRWSKSLRGGAFLAILIFLMNFLTGQGASFSIAMSIRFLCLLSSFSIFFLTTSPDDLGLALEQCHIPYALSFTFTTAVRLVPTMALDAQEIIDAQRSRGLELERGGLLRRVRNYIPILVPLIVCAIRRSLEMAEALESRAFGASERRTSLVTLRMGPRDYILMALSIALLASSIYISRSIQMPSLDALDGMLGLRWRIA